MRQARQDATRAQAAETAARVETERARGDAERMLAQFRAEAACERDELRADVRARAERAEREADAYRAEPAQVRAGAGHDADAKTARAGHIRQFGHQPEARPPPVASPLGASTLAAPR